MSKRGKAIIIVAPSGAGKSTLIGKLMQKYAQLKWSVSCTTRPPREGEVDGKDYHFINKDEFKSRIDDGDFIEWASVHSNYYGTSKKFVEEGLVRGEYLLFDIDVQGADALKNTLGDDAVAIFIAPPSLEELEKRLRGRNTDQADVIEERLKNARKEMLKKDDYDYLIVNDDLDKAYKELKEIFENTIS